MRRYQTHFSVLVVAGIIAFVLLGPHDSWQAARFPVAERPMEFLVFEQQLNEGQTLVFYPNLMSDVEGSLEFHTPSGRRISWGLTDRSEPMEIPIKKTGVHLLVLRTEAACRYAETHPEVEIIWMLTR